MNKHRKINHDESHRRQKQKALYKQHWEKLYKRFLALDHTPARAKRLAHRRANELLHGWK